MQPSTTIHNREIAKQVISRALADYRATEEVSVNGFVYDDAANEILDALGAEREISSDYTEVYCFTVEGRNDGVYVFADMDDRNRFERAVREAGGDGHAHEEPINAHAGAAELIAAELEGA